MCVSPRPLSLCRRGGSGGDFFAARTLLDFGPEFSTSARRRKSLRAVRGARFQRAAPPAEPFFRVTEHGSHDYVFQLFALSEAADIGTHPGRSGFMRAIAGHVLGAGMLVGTYSRGEDAVASGKKVAAGMSPA